MQQESCDEKEEDVAGPESEHHDNKKQQPTAALSPHGLFLLTMDLGLNLCIPMNGKLGFFCSLVMMTTNGVGCSSRTPPQSSGSRFQQCAHFLSNETAVSTVCFAVSACQQWACLGHFVHPQSSPWLVCSRRFQTRTPPTLCGFFSGFADGEMPRQMWWWAVVMAGALLGWCC